MKLINQNALLVSCSSIDHKAYTCRCEYAQDFQRVSKSPTITVCALVSFIKTPHYTPDILQDQDKGGSIITMTFGC